MCFGRNEDCWELGKVIPVWWSWLQLLITMLSIQVVHGLRECAAMTMHAQLMQTKGCRLVLYLPMNWDTSKKGLKWWLNHLLTTFCCTALECSMMVPMDDAELRMAMSWNPQQPMLKTFAYFHLAAKTTSLTISRMQLHSICSAK